MRDAGPDDVAAVRGLLHEYERLLGVDLGFQGFEEELASLPGDYDPSRGGALLVTDELDGCVALRRLDAETCELKRLFVHPAGRGSGRGRALLEAALARADELGYRRVRLDTLPSMEAAQALYRTVGFVEIPPYRPNPVPGATFWERATAPERD